MRRGKGLRLLVPRAKGDPEGRGAELGIPRGSRLDTCPVRGTGDADAQSQRDRHIRLVAERGRMAWQRATSYGRRSLAETAIGRYKAIVGPRLRARGLPAQQGEAAVVVEVLNRMIRTAKPISVRVA